MPNIMSRTDMRVDARKEYQEIDGFGVNINSKHWDDGGLIPVMELLTEDLGATLFRVDIYGKSNWIDPDNEKDASVLNREEYEKIYSSSVFRSGWSMMRYLNEKKIEPVIVATGDVPTWMLGDKKRSIDHIPKWMQRDTKQLEQYEHFSNMMVSLLDWARNEEGIRFKYFSPLNETDIGSPEGPSVSPEEFVKVMEVLDAKLEEKGLDDVRLVVGDQALFSSLYVEALVKSEALLGRIGAFGMHTYGWDRRYFDRTADEEYSRLGRIIKDSPYAGCRLWMTEYGDLDQSGEREWYVAWVSTSRLLKSLEHGFNGAMVWDAYDNYHEHDGAWTIYGLVRNARRVYTPKKRYYAAKQVYRFVLPGFVRVGVENEWEGIKMLGFANPERTKVTLVGMNLSDKGVYVNINLEEFSEGIMSEKVSYYRTTENEDCVKVKEVDVRSSNYPFHGIAVTVPAYAIFTLTNA